MKCEFAAEASLVLQCMRTKHETVSEEEAVAEAEAHEKERRQSNASRRQSNATRRTLARERSKA